MADQPIRKFMFERSFDSASAAQPARDRRPVTLSPEQLEAVKQEAYKSGFVTGRTQTSDDQIKHVAMTIDRIDAAIGHLIASAEAAKPLQEARLREAVLAVARKILPDFSQRNGMQEIEAVVAGVIGEMSSEPRLVVRVNEGQFESINERIKALTEKQGYAGKVVLLADAEVKADDCRVEWADGGVERNLESLWGNLGKTLAPGKEEAPVSSDAAG